MFVAMFLCVAIIRETVAAVVMKLSGYIGINIRSMLLNSQPSVGRGERFAVSGSAC